MTDHGKRALDHKSFLAALPADTRTALLLKSNSRGLGRLALHWGALLLVGALIGSKVPMWPLLILPQGILIIFTFTIMHECTHKTPFRTGWLNEAVGQVCGLLIAMPFQWFRYFHLAHHRFTHDETRDPELLGHPKPETLSQYVKHLSGIGIWAENFRTLLRNATGRCCDSFVPMGASVKIRVESIFIVLFYIVIALFSLTTSTALITAWIIPVLLGQPFLRLYLLAEHGRCPHVADMFENSRTTFTNRAVKTLTWNMPYHAEHHAYPNVPFHRLPDFHRLVRAHLKTTKNGYAAFHKDYILTLR